MKEEKKMQQIIFATQNPDKMREIRAIFADLGMEVLSMKEAGILLEVEEKGRTFEENARIKAAAVAECCQGIVLADDSGLEIDYLNQEPGVYSARYLGEDTAYEVKNRILLERLASVENELRTARFVCAIAAAFPDGRIETVRETMEGRIGDEAKGNHGFGYDPIFFLPEYGCSSAELSLEQKNAISHRGKALRKMRQVLAAWLADEQG